LRQGGEEERTRRRRRRYAARRCVRFVHVHARAHASAHEAAHTRNRADPPPGHLHKVIHWRSRSAVCSTITHSRITAETLDTPRHESISSRSLIAFKTRNGVASPSSPPLSLSLSLSLSLYLSLSLSLSRSFIKSADISIPKPEPRRPLRRPPLRHPDYDLDD